MKTHKRDAAHRTAFCLPYWTTSPPCPKTVENAFSFTSAYGRVWAQKTARMCSFFVPYSWMNVSAFPLAEPRPVRPIRWT